MNDTITIRPDKQIRKTLRIQPGGENELFYSESRLEKACIGHLRIDVDGCGKLWTSWWPHSAAQKYNRPPFRAEFDALINALQRELFRDQAKISGILSGIGVARMEDERYYVFHIETDDYRYYFRVYPGKGDYSYCYCYAKEGEADD